MKLWILKIAMVHGITEYGYKFVSKENCEKVGKEYVKVLRHGYYTCRLKTFPIKD